MLTTSHLIFSALEQWPLTEPCEMRVLEKGGRMMKKRRGGGDVQHIGLEHECQAVRGSWCGSVNLAGG